MADLGLPESPRRCVPAHAVEVLRRTLVAAPCPVTLVPLAPLTNIALLLRTYPEVADRVERIVLMGGARAVGDAAAEFNVRHDPEAAAIVFDAGVPMTMYGLDVFFDVTVDRADVERLLASRGPARQLAGRLLEHQLSRFGGDRATIGDAGAVASVIDPDGLTTRPRRVRVELAGQYTRGQTVVEEPASIDRVTGEPPSAGVADVAFAVDGARYRALFLDTLAP